MRVLIIEDDLDIAGNLYEFLEGRGNVVDLARDGITGMHLAVSENFDAIVLDLGLPGVDGLCLCRKLRREAKQDVPVLILTARDATGDKIAGLDAGADDYVVKPIDLDELAARVRALARRTTGRAAPLLEHGDLVLDPAAHQIKRAGVPVDLSVREFALLQTLLENRGRVMTRAQLEGSLYGWRDEPDSNALEVHVHHLRKKLGADLIRTLRGVGYMVAK